MNNVIVANTLRFIALAAVQGLVFQNVGAAWEGFPYIFVIVYPVFILLLPLRTPRALALLLAFAIGITVDAFYSTPGVNASAAVFMAFVRPFVLRFLEPRGGYNVNYSPTVARMGMGWFLRYSATLMLVYLFFYFSVEAFTFVYIGEILLKTLFSFIISMIFVIIYQVLFNPVE